MTGNADLATWSLDREIVLSRVFDAPRDVVFKAWTDADQVTQWFCPKGYTKTTHEIDVRVGGRWRFNMVGPGGKEWPSRIVYLEISAPDRLVYEHGGDKDDDPTRFRVTITFDAQSDGKTVVTMRQIHPTKQQRDAGVGFGAVEIGYGTIDNLATHLARMK